MCIMIVLVASVSIRKRSCFLDVVPMWIMQVTRILITRWLFLERIIPRRVIKLALYRAPNYAPPWMQRVLNKFMHLARRDRDIKVWEPLWVIYRLLYASSVFVMLRDGPIELHIHSFSRRRNDNSQFLSQLVEDGPRGKRNYRLFWLAFYVKSG